MRETLFDFPKSAGLLVHEWTKQPQPPAAELAQISPSAWAEQLELEHPDATPLPRVDLRHSLPSYGQMFANRHSRRAYADTPLSRADLARFLALAAPPQPSAPQDSAPFAGVRPYRATPSGLALVPLVQNVADVAPGAYLYSAQRQQLHPLQSDHPRAVFGPLCFQQEFVPAPLICLVVGSLHDYLARYGDRGYRYLLLAVGTQAQRCYFAASALGLNGSMFSSFFQQRINLWLGFDGYQAAALVAFAVGYAPEEHQ